MGCALSKTQDEHNSGQARVQTEEFCVFVPGLRLPKGLELGKLQQANSSNSVLIQRMDSLHTKIVVAAEALVLPRKLRKKKSSTHGSSTASSISQLREALEEYLPVLFRLLKKEPDLAEQIMFTWTNQEDEIKETTVRSPYYEVLSVLQLLGALSLLEANKALTFKASADSTKLIDESKKIVIDILLKAAQILERALKSVLPEAPHDVRSQLPADVTEAVLQALQLQALGQTAEIQLGLAIDNAKATMAVKRRLACEVVKYWQQAYEKLQTVRLGNGWGEKHILFVKWKGAEAKAAAYYYHGLILNEGADKRKAAACLQASEHFFKESETIRGDFSSTAPMTRIYVGRSPLWGAMKYLSERIPKDARSLAHMIQPGHFDVRATEKLPQLPDFPLALQVEEYQVPSGEDDESNEETDLLNEKDMVEVLNT